MDYLFKERKTSALFEYALNTIKFKIENLSNEQIYGVDLEELEGYYVNANGNRADRAFQRECDQRALREQNERV